MNYQEQLGCWLVTLNACKTLKYLFQELLQNTIWVAFYDLEIYHTFFVN